MTEIVPSPEKPIRFLPFAHLESNEAIQLKQEVERHRNTIQVWVHPHFQEHDLKRAYKQFNTKVDHYVDARTALLDRSLNYSHMPIIAMLDCQADSEDRQRQLAYIKEQSQKRRNVYYLSTETESPFPYDYAKTISLGDYAAMGRGAYERKGWDEFAYGLKVYNVKNIIMSGGFVSKMTIDNPLAGNEMRWQQNQLTVEHYQGNGCLSETYVKLQERGFNIFVSDVVLGFY